MWLLAFKKSRMSGPHARTSLDILRSIRSAGSDAKCTYTPARSKDQPPKKISVSVLSIDAAPLKQDTLYSRTFFVLARGVAEKLSVVCEDREFFEHLALKGSGAMYEVTLRFRRHRAKHYSTTIQIMAGKEVLKTVPFHTEVVGAKGSTLCSPYRAKSPTRGAPRGTATKS